PLEPPQLADSPAAASRAVMFIDPSRSPNGERSRSSPCGGRLSAMERRRPRRPQPKRAAPLCMRLLRDGTNATKANVTLRVEDVAGGDASAPRGLQQSS